METRTSLVYWRRDKRSVWLNGNQRGKEWSEQKCQRTREEPDCFGIVSNSKQFRAGQGEDYLDGMYRLSMLSCLLYPVISENFVACEC